MSTVTPTEAIRLTGRPRQSLYDAMDNGDLSYEQLEPRKRQIDVAELERWNGGLKNPNEEAISEDVRSDIGFGHHKTSESDKGLIAENATLKERLSQIESRRAEEKRGLEDQVDFLKERIEKMDSVQLQMTAQLEDHREGRSRAEKRGDVVRDELQQELDKVKTAYGNKRRELEGRERDFDAALKEAWSLPSLMRKLTGQAAPQKKSGRRPSQRKSA